MTLPDLLLLVLKRLLLPLPIACNNLPVLLVVKQVRYKGGCDASITLPIPLDAAINTSEVIAYQERKQKRQKMDTSDGVGSTTSASTTAPATGEEEEEVKPVIPFGACIEQLAAPEMLVDSIRKTWDCYQTNTFWTSRPRT